MASRLLFLLICVGFVMFAAAAGPSCESGQQKGVIYYNATNYPPDSPIQSNIIQATDNAINAARNASPTSDGVRVGTGTAGSGNTTVYAYGECYGLNANDCGNCLVNERNAIKNYGPSSRSVGGRLCTNQCSIRFEIYSFYSAAEDVELESVVETV